ncbi:MAG: ATP synthase F1 subunit delta [Candidatus Aminicenantes bacterium]|nr:ATP synthase F1 subunit delta [Candidatus Aminicenantes bacterium]
MRENSIARRYALGLIKALKDEKEYRKIKAELESFLKLLLSNDEFKAGMETSLFSKQQKLELIESINKEVGFSEKTFNLLLTMTDQNRLAILDLIILELEELWFERNNIEKLKVYSAVALNEKLEKKLTKKLEKSFGKQILLEKEVDKSLIAGIKIQQGSIFYDFSISGNLRKLKDALLTETAPAVSAAASAKEL